MTEPTTTSDPYVSALVDSEAAAQDVVSDNLVALILAIWSSFEAFYAGEAVAAFGARIATYVVAAQRQAARITEAHLRQQMLRMDYALPATPIVDLPADLRLGAATEDVYQRPIRQVRYLESTGVPLTDAVQAATERLEKMALTDLQLARATASQQVMYSTDEDEEEAGPIRGYRRVIHPELGAVCGLCIAAADRIYQKKDLLALHPGCKCTPIPVIGVQDPGGKLNAEDLAQLYLDAGSTSTEALRQTRYEIGENGELGPVLTPAGARLTTAERAIEQLSDRAKKMRREQLARQIEEMRGPASRSQWHADRLEQLEELLRAA